MRLPKILIVVVVGVLLGSIGVEVYMLSKGKNNVAPKTTQNPDGHTPTPTLAPGAKWDDPMGFSFQYAKDATVDNHEEDNLNYAHVEITHVSHPGNLVVWASDPPADGQIDVTAWAAAEKRFSGANSLDTTLGGQQAKKIVLTTPKRTVITGAFYDGLLFYIETTLDEGGYWQREHERVVDSFAFSPASDEREEQSEGLVEEEEVVE